MSNNQSPKFIEFQNQVMVGRKEETKIHPMLIQLEAITHVIKNTGGGANIFIINEKDKYSTVESYEQVVEKIKALQKGVN